MIQNLEEYTGLKALWLEGNGLTKIQGLEAQTLLKSLFLHENLIEKIDGLDSQADLDTLNLSKNHIKKIENLSHMTKLTSLNLAHNAIKTAEAIRHVVEIPSLQTIDLQHNKIEEEEIVDVLAELPDLRVLYLMGNPAVKKIRNYRRTIVSRCKQLRYLDDRPVFDEERRRTTAWAKALEETGSLEAAQEAERNELKEIRREKDEVDERNFRAFEQLMIEGKEHRRQQQLRDAQGQDNVTSSDEESRDIAEAQDKSEDGETEEIEINPHSGERIIHVPESEELRKVRESRWGPDRVPFEQRMKQQTTSTGRDEIAADQPVDEEQIKSNNDLWAEVHDLSGGILEHKTADGEESTPDEASEGVPVKTGKFSSLLAEAAQEAATEVKTITSSQIEIIDGTDLEELD